MRHRIANQHHIAVNGQEHIEVITLVELQHTQLVAKVECVKRQASNEAHIRSEARHALPKVIADVIDHVDAKRRIRQAATHHPPREQEVLHANGKVGAVLGHAGSEYANLAFAV